MPEWTPPRSDDTVIAHLSDLHFGSSGVEACWQSVRDFVVNTVSPDVLIVTGDLVDNPDQKLYEHARTEIEACAGTKRYFVCPGNHDRHTKGNASRVLAWLTQSGATSAIFDRTFSKAALQPDRITVSHVGSYGLRLGLLGVDSCLPADYSARGYVDQVVLQRLVDAVAKADDVDLVMLLVHHHVQSVRNLEAKRQNRLQDLLNVTSMVNSGSFLEAVAKAHVNVVLHGHEHSVHWARYGSLEGGRDEVCIVGAGSATGNSSIGGCSQQDASFNVILVSQTGGARLRVIAFEGGQWRIRDELPLFDAAAGRRSRLLRRAPNVRSEIDAQVTKHVEFTRERDIVVRWVFTNWLLDQPVYSHVIENGTGRPVDAWVTFIKDGRSKVQSEVVLDRVRGRDHAWLIAAEVPEDYRGGTRVRIELSYRWLGGALLTAEEMSAVAQGTAPGVLRGDRMEFASITASPPSGGPPGGGAAVAAVRLVVVIPPEFDPGSVDIRAFDEADKARPTESLELRTNVVNLGPGRYTLTVPYPRETWWYALAWRPVAARQSPNAVTLRSLPAADAGSALREFQLGLRASMRTGRFSLYAFDPATRLATRVAHLETEAQARSEPAPQVPLVGDRSALGQAFWGVPVRFARPPGDDATAVEIGFQPDEQVLLALPVRFGLNWTNPAPWGVLRIGVSQGALAQSPAWEQELGALEAALLPAVTRLLTALLQER